MWFRIFVVNDNTVVDQSARRELQMVTDLKVCRDLVLGQYLCAVLVAPCPDFIRYVADVKQRGFRLPFGNERTQTLNPIEDARCREFAQSSVCRHPAHVEHLAQLFLRGSFRVGLPVPPLNPIQNETLELLVECDWRFGSAHGLDCKRIYRYHQVKSL